MTTTIQRGCDANGVLLRFMFSLGHSSDIAHAQLQLDQARAPDKPGGGASAVAY
jgi:hypothetical protein